MKKGIIALLLVACIAFAPIASGCNGENSLSGYTIVYASSGSGLERSAAEFLSDYIKNVTGINVAVRADNDVSEGSKEILIGNTNRASSVAVDSYSDEQVLIMRKNSQIVLNGKDLMLSGAVGQFASSYIKSNGTLKEMSDKQAPIAYRTAATQNVIICIGDGMGPYHVEAFRDEGNVFYADYLPYEGELISSSLTTISSGTATCSGAAGSALFTGVKTNNEKLGVDKNNKPMRNIRELASDNGYKTGVVTTDIAWGCTPGAFTAHVVQRYNEIAYVKAQQQALLDAGKLDYLVGTGTGLNWNHPESAPYIQSSSGLIHPGTRGTDAYEYVREGLFAVRSASGFMMLIEEDDIDNFGHEQLELVAAGKVSGTFIDERMESRVDNLLYAMERFNRYVGYAITFALAHPGTAIVVTADHENGGLAKLSDGSYRYAQSGEPGAYAHTAVNVPIYGYGDIWEVVDDAIIDNTDLAKTIATVLGDADFGGEEITVDAAAAFIAAVNNLPDDPDVRILNGIKNLVYNNVTAADRTRSDVVDAYATLSALLAA